MNAYGIIRKKRDGGILSTAEVRYFIDGYVAGAIPDYQMAALLMAVFLRGMDKRETVAMTEVFMSGGTAVDPASLGNSTVDKHSTGGVGDKVSLPLAPLVAAAGGRVPMMSGRGLGHTGGTLDKLESIPGFTTVLDLDHYTRLVRGVGCVIVGQSAQFVPADRKIYALRDVTATVDSIPLIASSIMSKKLAAGPRALVLDVKTGNGAFMRRTEQAEELARTMVEIGAGMDRRVTAFITDMNQPLGRTAGNSLEIKETVQFLRGDGAADLTHLVLTFGAHMLYMAGVATSVHEGRELVEKARRSGAGFEKFKEMVAAQGGDVAVLDDPDRLPAARNITPIAARESGWIAGMNTLELGLVNVALGAGRLRMEDRIDHAAGMVFLHKLGDRVARGEPILEVHHNGTLTIGLENRIHSACTIQDAPVTPPPLIYSSIPAATGERQ
ncbi:thymidine phosphorylase [bacterium]|nr:thymidine phosphorylase [candidate division CSSED10-310 bacterium]